MKHAAPSITTPAASATGLKMWDKNCTQTNYLHSYLMICVLRQWTAVGMSGQI